MQEQNRQTGDPYSLPTMAKLLAKFVSSVNKSNHSIQCRDDLRAEKKELVRNCTSAKETKYCRAKKYF